MGRTVNTELISLEHLEWDHDSSVVFLQKQMIESKNHKDGKHFDANPLKIEIPN
jgi:hypothetical protein